MARGRRQILSIISIFYLIFSRKEIWARNQLTADYQLLCRDGTRKRATDYRNCYLGKVAANAMVTNPFFKKQNINAFINLFKYAQQFYGQKMKNEFSFSMFYSEPPYADLIFSDAAQKIIVLNESEYIIEIFGLRSILKLPTHSSTSLPELPWPRVYESL